MEIDELTLHWLAGLLEGEGSFTAGIPANPAKPIISLQMTDEDVVAKVAAIFQVKYHQVEMNHEKGWRDTYRLRIAGKKAVAVMKLLRPLMGERRQGQIDKALACYNGDTRKVITLEQIEDIRNRSQNGENVLTLAREYGISKSLAYAIRNGYTHKSE